MKMKRFLRVVGVVGLLSLPGSGRVVLGLPRVIRGLRFGEASAKIAFDNHLEGSSIKRCGDGVNP
jgi:hypothetical protein